MCCATPRRPRLSLAAVRLVAALAACVLLTGAVTARKAVAQAPATLQELRSQPPRAWAEAGAANQERIVTTSDNVPLRYRVRKVDARGDTTREVIESRDGTVARLVQRDGRPLTPAEDAAERERLQGMLSHPDLLLKRHRRERAGREYALELLRALPGAMIWTYAPGQPQLPNVRGPQVVVDFTPDPHFKPPTLLSEGLTGLAGRVWLDASSRCVERIQGRVIRSVDFGWGGMLARVSEGGTVELDQTLISEQRWFYSHLREHILLREMLIRNVVEDVESTAWEAHPLSNSVSFEEAIHALLALPVPTH